jgi:hypothetical protein
MTMFGVSKEINDRLNELETHVRHENPLLVEAVRNYRRLDKVAYGLGLLSREQSYATQITWWPLVSVLGTFSSGKSTFLNRHLQSDLQETGNQAVDDKFTVVCYSSDGTERTLPGVALDSDPRFPFYQFARELDKVIPGEGAKVDAYLQLKTCASNPAKGYILIDSPGFDADAQRTSTLRITDYIIDLSDLVLVFFDARHPEPGAMQDTLTHLVANTIKRNDANKFIYILNQIDVTAKEDNPEDVIAAWQRALAQEGLTTGRFYTIYDPQVAVPIDDPAVRQRFESKREEDIGAIRDRIAQVHVERVYRVLGNLDKQAREIEQRQLPRLRSLVRRWEKATLWRDAIVISLLVAALLAGSYAAGVWTVRPLSWDSPSWFAAMLESLWGKIGMAALIVLILFGIHHLMRLWSRHSTMRSLDEMELGERSKEELRSAFAKNTRFIHSVFRPEVVGWHFLARRRLARVLANADHGIQELNDRYTRPSGGDASQSDAPFPAPSAEPTPTPDAAAAAPKAETPVGLQQDSESTAPSPR